MENDDEIKKEHPGKNQALGIVESPDLKMSPRE
jgi:hypothetical protein